MKYLAILLAAVASCLSLSSCGGGGGSGSDASPPTVRPKTLDGLTLTVDSNVNFDFIRNTGTPPALVSGDVESGVFFYTRGGFDRRTYPNSIGDNSDARWPDAVTNASYTYRAINNTAGLLTLTGVGVNDLNTTGRFTANNGSFTYFFNSDSASTVNNTVEIDLTFSTNGVSISTPTPTVRIPGSTSIPNYDIVRIPSRLTIAGGAGFVPENYNPTIDPLRDSRIAPASLNDVLMNFTNGIPNPIFDFTVQFVADVVSLPPSGSDAPDEVGQGFLRLAGAPVDDAVDYTWKRIGGTDNGILTISGSNGTLDGRYTLKFAGIDNGSYIGEVDGDTTDAAEVSGKIFLPNVTKL